jgi:2-dehydropantoate 2-reductase
MTPMLPKDYERLRAALGERIVAAMPSVVAYAKPDGTTRYWLPRPATTLIEEPRTAHDAALAELVGALGRAKIPSRFAMGVHEENPATTVAFLPLAMGLDAAGGLDALLGDASLLTLTLRAASEAGALASKIGKVATWASLIMRFIGPHTLRVGVALARRRSPEAMQYVDEHFGRKVHAQNVAMAEAIVELAEEKATPREALRELTARLASRDAPAAREADAVDRPTNEPEGES